MRIRYAFLAASSLFACGQTAESTKTAATAASPQNSAEALTNNPSSAVFTKVDANGDGKLDSSEVPADVWAVLVLADADADGFVTLDEVINAIIAGTIKPPHGKPHHPHSPPFEKIDANGDGSIDQTEAGKFWPEVSKADADGDGLVTKAELQAAIQAGTFTPPHGQQGQSGQSGPSGVTGGSGCEHGGDDGDDEGDDDGDDHHGEHEDDEDEDHGHGHGHGHAGAGGASGATGPVTTP